MPPNQPLPDFSTFFAKTVVEPLRFKTRPNVNYHHEIIFLSSYLHDARFRRSDVAESGGTLTIPLERDCWEFSTRLHGEIGSLLTAPSLLTISGVAQCLWSTDPGDALLSLRSVFIGERQQLAEETSHLVFDCPYQKLRIDLLGSDPFFDLTLEDQAVPE